MAYYTLEPFGEHMADLRHGIAVATLANIHRTQQSKPFKATDFIWWHEETPAAKENGPLLLEDANAHTELLITALFGGLKVTRAPSH